MEQTMTQQHSPGPWETSVHMNGARAIYGADATRIGEMYGDPNREDVVADARLIAAAPGLLAALQAFVETEVDTNGVCHYCGREATAHSPGCNVLTAQAAIRKATGDA